MDDLLFDLPVIVVNPSLHRIEYQRFIEVRAAGCIPDMDLYTDTGMERVFQLGALEDEIANVVQRLLRFDNAGNISLPCNQTTGVGFRGRLPVNHKFNWFFLTCLRLSGQFGHSGLSINDTYVSEPINMRFTNRHDIPETIVRASEVMRKKYNKGKVDRSVTQLISSPRIDLLRKRHWEDMENDISEEWFSLFGTAIHHILDAGRTVMQTTEERLYGSLDGWEFSGAIDVQEPVPSGYRISDYKVCSASQAMKAMNSGKSEWEAQQNIYAWLVRNAKGIEVTEICVVAIIRDWQRWKAKFDPTYPSAAIKVIDLPLWTPEEQEQYILARIRAHRNAEMNIEIGADIPECSDEERWASPPKWAVKKGEDSRRATKVFDTKDEAVAFAKEKQCSVIEHRPGSSMRCEENFCRVAEWCDQFARMKEE